VQIAPIRCRAANRYQRILVEQLVLPRRAAGHVEVLWSPGYTMPLRPAVPAVTSVLDLQYRAHPEDLKFQARLATAFLVRRACRRSRIVLTLSRFSQREIERYTGTPPERIRVTPLAADPSFGEPLPETERSRRCAALTCRPAPYLLCVAHTYPHKNVHAAVEAFARLQQRIPHDFVLVGQPRLGEPRLQDALRSLDDPRRFIRLHRVARRDLIALYQGSGAFVFPSTYEGFGLPVLEAMTAGVPVITTRCGAIPEVAAEHAWYADPASGTDLPEQILEVLEQPPAERRRRIEAASRHAAGFSWNRTASGTLAALREAAER
jgi:alpha-1,3-rhamnosyl/mannosyltransferase